jgi:hypothetical protein
MGESPSKVQCPNCFHRMPAPQERPGRMCRCGKCNQLFAVETQEMPPLPRSETAPPTGARARSNVCDAAERQGLWPAATEPSPVRFVYHAILTSILFLLVANAPISLAVWLKTGTIFFLLVPNPLANLVIATAGLAHLPFLRAKLTAVRSPWPLFWYVAAAVLLPLVAIVAQFEFANWHVFHALWHGR